MSAFLVMDACVFLIELFVKIALIVGGCAVLAKLVRDRYPAGAHCIWMIGLGAAVVMPVVSAVVPWKSVLFLNLEARRPVVRSVSETPAVPATLIGNGARAVENSRHPAGVEEFDLAQQNLSVLRSPLIQGLLALWMVGFMVVLVRMSNGLYLLRAIGTFGTQSLPEPWMAEAVTAAAERLGLQRRVKVRLSSSDAFPVPITWGVFSPVVVLPQEASAWSESRLEATLLHEMAHVKRFDFVSQLIAEFICASYWFHPAVWFASRSLRSDAELAADEAVVRSGFRPSVYASELLSIAAEIRGRHIPFAALGTHAMKNSKIETRLESILSPSAGRRGITTVQVLAGLVVAVAAVPVFASLHASTQSGEDGSSADQRTLALSNVKQICLGTMMYSQDWDGIFPYVQQSASAMAVISPYIRSSKVFHSPTKGGKFVYNMNVGGVDVTDIPEPAATPLWIEILPNPKDKNAVGFIDGHAKFINEADRPSITKAAAKKFKRSPKSKPLPPNEGLGKGAPFSRDDAGSQLAVPATLVTPVVPTAAAPKKKG